MEEMTNMEAKVEVPVSFLEKVAKQTGDSMKIAEKQASWERDIAEAVPATVEALVQGGLLNSHLKEAKIREYTTNPASMCSDLQKLAATTYKQEKPNSLGTSVSKQSSAAGSISQKESDLVFLEQLMG